MRIIAFIEEQPVIKKILSHETEFTNDTAYSQLPLTDYWDQ